jgi:hypothetical protein
MVYSFWLDNIQIYFKKTVLQKIVSIVSYAEYDFKKEIENSSFKNLNTFNPLGVSQILFSI